MQTRDTDIGFVPLPVRIEDITAGWLSEALSARYPGTLVTAFEQDHVIYGTAAKVRVRLEFNEAGREAHLPASMWVKLGLGEHRHMMAPAYLDEMRFYRELQPRLGVNAPACYFAGHDERADQSVVILEDLALRGARLWHATDALTYQQAAGFLNEQAAYHARFWNSPDLDDGGPIGWLATLGGDQTTMKYAEMHLAAEAWASCMHEPRGVVLPRILQDREWMGRAFNELIELDQRRPHCVLHSDTHIGNLYSEAGGQPGFLDWQAPRKGPWAHDVTYFIVSALDWVDRRKWEKPLLAHYLSRLELHGVKAPDFEDAWLAYRQQVIWGLFFWTVNPIAFQPEVVDTVYSSRFAIAAIDVGTHDVIG